jgi:hypothetical protein
MERLQLSLQVKEKERDLRVALEKHAFDVGRVDASSSLNSSIGAEFFAYLERTELDVKRFVFDRPTVLRGTGGTDYLSCGFVSVANARLVHIEII